MLRAIIIFLFVISGVSIAQAEVICNFNSEKTNLRKGPSAKNYDLAATLRNGDDVTVLERITNPDGYDYLLVEYLDSAGSESKAYVYHEAVSSSCNVNRCSLPKKYVSLCNYIPTKKQTLVSDTYGIGYYDSEDAYFENPSIRRYLRLSKTRFPMQELIGMSLADNTDAMTIVADAFEDTEWRKYWMTRAYQLGNRLAIDEHFDNLLKSINSSAKSKAEKKILKQKLRTKRKEYELTSYSKLANNQKVSNYVKAHAEAFIARRSSTPYLYDSARTNIIAGDEVVTILTRGWPFPGELPDNISFDILETDVESPKLNLFQAYCLAGAGKAFDSGKIKLCTPQPAKNLEGAYAYLKRAAEKKAIFENDSFSNTGYVVSQEFYEYNYILNILEFTKNSITFEDLKFWVNLIENKYYRYANNEIKKLFYFIKDPIFSDTSYDNFTKYISSNSSSKKSEWTYYGYNGYIKSIQNNEKISDGSFSFQFPNVKLDDYDYHLNSVSKKYSQSLNSCVKIESRRLYPCGFGPNSKRKFNSQTTVADFSEFAKALLDQSSEISKYVAKFEPPNDRANYLLDKAILQRSAYIRNLSKSKFSWFYKIELGNHSDADFENFDTEVRKFRKNRCQSRKPEYALEYTYLDRVRKLGIHTTNNFSSFEPVPDLDWLGCNNYDIEFRRPEVINEAQKLGSIYALVFLSDLKFTDNKYSYIPPYDPGKLEFTSRSGRDETPLPFLHKSYSLP